MPRSLEPYHVIWLSVHPQRSENWLRDKLSDGFDIHHVDGDHSNNDPNNLVLIEHRDHFMLHGGRPKFVRSAKPGPRKRAPNKRLKIGQRAYYWYRNGASWEKAAYEIGCSSDHVRKAAKEWCLENNVNWPIRRISMSLAA